MAPPHNQVRFSMPPLSLSTEHHRRRCSKAQMCLFKILNIISVFPVTENKCFSNDDEIRENKRFVVDLNIRLGPLVTETEPYEYRATDAVGENCVLEKNDRLKGEAEESELAVEEERATEHSEISHVGDQSSGIDYNGVSELVSEEEKPRDEGFLGLLIEAAQLILGDDSEHDKQPTSLKTEPRRSKHVDPPATATTRGGGGGAKRKQQCWTAAAEAEWYAEFEDTSPVVKSKRGRNQVLPFRYRDSVVEPLVRWPSSTSTTTTTSRKSISRRSK